MTSPRRLAQMEAGTAERGQEMAGGLVIRRLARVGETISCVMAQTLCTHG